MHTNKYKTKTIIGIPQIGPFATIQFEFDASFLRRIKKIILFV